MAVPKKKTSRTKRNTRRSHDSITAPSVGTCPECGSPAEPHRVCPECGKYKGKEVIVVEES
ncbi:MAG TPA: 50S ribosomal protein L32 [Nitrospinota bacterium]|nr:50S ribosomal protein L32 [Nitrospinota bacterium]